MTIFVVFDTFDTLIKFMYVCMYVCMHACMHACMLVFSDDLELWALLGTPLNFEPITSAIV